ncbi:MAG: peptidoglycan-binding protein [Gaiellaceae bacterium]
MARIVAFAAALLVGVTLAATAQANSQIAGLQVALRAYGYYRGQIDSIAGPQTVAATKAFQHRAGLSASGYAGPRTRRALGPLGRPFFGRRTLRRGMIGWDVSVLQFLLARRGALVPVDGYFDRATERAVRRYQARRRLARDGIVGRITLAALAGRHRELAPIPAVVRRRTIPSSVVRSLLGYWARYYGLRSGLVRALAWMESGYNTDLVSSSGARGALQVLPSTHRYVESVLLGRRVATTPAGEIQVGVAYLRELLREFHGNDRFALSAWLQGPASVRRYGARRPTRIFVADVLALARRGV